MKLIDYFLHKGVWISIHCQNNEYYTSFLNVEKSPHSWTPIDPEPKSSYNESVSEAKLFLEEK